MSTDPTRYGHAHRKARRYWAKRVALGDVTCCLCGALIKPNSQWHLDHTIDGDGYRGAAHAFCNMQEGGKRGRAKQVELGINNRGVKTKWETSPCQSCGKQCYGTQCQSCYHSRGSSTEPKPMPSCMDCGVALTKRSQKRCAMCAAEKNRTGARNTYRRRVGIATEAPLYTRARRLEI